MVDQLSEQDLQHMGFVSAARAESAANIAAARFGPGVYLADPVRTAPTQWAVYTDTWQYVGSVFARTKKEALARAAQEHRVENPQVDKLEIGLKVFSIFRVRDEALPKVSVPPLEPARGTPWQVPKEEVFPEPTEPPTPPEPKQVQLQIFQGACLRNAKTETAGGLTWKINSRSADEWMLQEPIQLTENNKVVASWIQRNMEEKTFTTSDGREGRAVLRGVGVSPNQDCPTAKGWITIDRVDITLTRPA